MKDSTFKILNDEQLLGAKHAWFRKMEDFYKGKTDGSTFNLNGLLFYPPNVDPYTQPEQFVSAALDFMADHARRIEDDNVFRPLALEVGLYGVHFTDKLLGANVRIVDGQWHTDYLTSEIGALKTPDLTKSETWRLAMRIADAFLAADVKLPVFGLPTIASALNVAVNLYGENILTELYIEPENAACDLKTINDLAIELHKRYIALIPAENLQPVVAWERTQPAGYGQLCGCSTQMISADMYGEFIAPLDNELLGAYPNGGMIHLCGTHSQHIPTFKKMSNLKSLQLHNRAAQDLELYLDGLRDDQILYVNCCEEMPYERAYEISGGNRVIFVGEFPKRAYRSNK